MCGALVSATTQLVACMHALSLTRPTHTHTQLWRQPTVESAKGIASAMKEPPPSDIVEEATLTPLLQSSISAALQAYAKQFPDDSRERKLTCVLTWGRRPCRAPQELGVEDAKVGVIGVAVVPRGSAQQTP